MRRSRQVIAPHSKSAQANHQRIESHKGSGLLLEVRVAGFKPHPSPYGDEHVQQFSFKLLANQDLPKALGKDFFFQWAKVNPREQKLGGPVMREVERTWYEYPREFFRINRGLVFSAESVTFDNDSGLAKIQFATPQKHGGVDGMHTLRTIIDELIPSTYSPPEDDVDDDPTNGDVESNEEEEEEEQIEPEPERYITCEVWTGLTLDQVARLSQGRNTSRTVPPYGIMAIKGDFQALEKAIAECNPGYAKQVAFKPNQHIEDLEDFRPISVLEILQLMMAMDITNSDADKHPIDAYKNRSKGPEYFAPMHDAEGKVVNTKSRHAEYEQMFPLIGDFLDLFDQLRQTVPAAYDAAKNRPRYWTKVLAGKGKVNRKQVEPLFYVDPSGQTKVVTAPASLFFPIFSAFRAHLKKDGSRYAWTDGKSPLQWPKEEFFQVCQRLAIKIAKAARQKSSLHDVARDEQVWDTCYETLNAELLANGRKKR